MNKPVNVFMVGLHRDHFIKKCKNQKQADIFLSQIKCHPYQKERQYYTSPVEDKRRHYNND